jgi:hypothetical protein
LKRLGNWKLPCVTPCFGGFAGRHVARQIQGQHAGVASTLPETLARRTENDLIQHAGLFANQTVEIGRLESHSPTIA